MTTRSSTGFVGGPSPAHRPYLTEATQVTASSPQPIRESGSGKEVTVAPLSSTSTHSPESSKTATPGREKKTAMAHHSAIGTAGVSMMSAGISQFIHHPVYTFKTHRQRKSNLSIGEFLRNATSNPRFLFKGQ